VRLDPYRLSATILYVTCYEKTYRANGSMNLVDYLSGISNAALGRQNEGFANPLESMTPLSIAESVRNLYTSLPILFIFNAILALIYGYGAARLSYCYQMSTNPTSNFLFLYVYLAFVFSPVYYPYYAIVLNPMCISPKNRISTVVNR